MPEDFTDMPGPASLGTSPKRAVDASWTSEYAALNIDWVRPVLEGMGVTLPPPSPGVPIVTTPVLLQPVAGAVSGASVTVSTGGDELADAVVKAAAALSRGQAGTPSVGVPTPTNVAPEDRYAALKTLLVVALPCGTFVDLIVGGLSLDTADGALWGLAAAVIIVILFWTDDLNRFADWVTERMNRD